ncbi:MAG: peptide chain release factor N(5)-glutamine methyltransferase [Candidatus Omnitrophica bacterium]|nr:peptide chain release factor N(5)-glutamine methyltransferase [Candidatus Omnitrophota bacterium]
MNETELLFTEVLGCTRAELYLEKKRILSREICSQISRVLKRRLKGEPLEYILGHAEFMGLEFAVNSDVLIPRADTEVLVETVLNYFTNFPDYRFQNPRILELGTGSGCIAISLAKRLSEADIVATDVSQAALDVAEANARKNSVEGSISFFLSDLFASPRIAIEKYDLIISNPPYIKRDVIPTLACEVQHEPRLALDGGADGLDFYRRIFREAPKHLKAGGLMILEIGFDQKDELEKILSSLQIFEVKEIIKDYNNINRVLVLKIKE